MKRVPRWQHHRCVGGLMVAVLVTTAFSTQINADPALPVAVRTYNYARLPAEQLTNARFNVDVIFKSAGVSVRWTDCRVPQTESGAACIEPLGDRGDLLLRLTDVAPMSSGPTVALGASLLDRKQRSGVLMTVDVFPIRTIAERTSMDLSTLLGRAIAHEMGHLLLGSSRHTNSGLMRAFWSHEELLGLKPAHWQLSREEAAQIRYGLTAKGRGAN